MPDMAPVSPVAEVWLSSRVRVKKYLGMAQAEDRAGIAKFLHDRFMERYISPLKAVKAGEENGFLIMASCCLLIEGLTAFREGWCSTEGLSERAFQLFFDQEDRFALFRGHEHDFWKSVRCGILHQGETGSGWTLNFTDRFGELFVASGKRVNCCKFMEQLEAVLADYRDLLSRTPWNYEQWRNVRRKMEATIKDCQP